MLAPLSTALGLQILGRNALIDLPPLPHYRKRGGFLLTLQEKIKKLAGSAAGAGRRWLRRLRSQTQALTAQEATFEGRGEREEISLRQCVLRDHQIRIGSGLFIHSAST